MYCRASPYPCAPPISLKPCLVRPSDLYPPQAAFYVDWYCSIFLGHQSCPMIHYPFQCSHNRRLMFFLYLLWRPGYLELFSSDVYMFWLFFNRVFRWYKRMTYRLESVRIPRFWYCWMKGRGSEEPRSEKRCWHFDGICKKTWRHHVNNLFFLCEELQRTRNKVIRFLVTPRSERRLGMYGVSVNGPAIFDTDQYCL